MSAAANPISKGLRFSILITFVLLLMSCSMVLVPESASSPAQSTDVEEGITQSTEPPKIIMDTFEIGQQGTTFLAWVESQLVEATTQPDRRSYIELADSSGVRWQGERHDFADRSLLYLQQSNSTGVSALRIDAPFDTTETILVQHLPVPSPSGDAPNVEVYFVQARLSDAGTWTFTVTVEHPDTGWEDYADGWQVESPNGEILGLRILLHPHMDEQPFTRSLSGVEIPEGVEDVRIRTHDLVSGYGPVAVTLPILTAGEGAKYEVIR